MVPLEKITNTYAERRRLHEVFKKESSALVATLKSKYKGFKNIDIASVFFIHPHDQEMQYMHLAILNTSNRKCILLQVQCDAKLYYWQYELKQPLQKAEAYLRSRYRERDFPTTGRREVTLKKLFARDIPFMAMLGLQKMEYAA